jgi:hypothetical protein
MTSKIGRSTILKQSEAGPYVTIGIAKVEGGYELRKLTMSGTDVKHIKVLHKSDNRAEIMMELQIALSQYSINFNESNKGD